VWKWFEYGAYNLDIEKPNVHYRLFNNQTDGAIVRNCGGPDATNCRGAQLANTYMDYNYRGFKSILIAPE
jgi:hypothetical protein